MALCPMPKWTASSMQLSWSSLMSTSICWFFTTEQQISHARVAIKCSTLCWYECWHLCTHDKVNWQCTLQNCFLGKKITAHWWNKHSWQPLSCSGLWIHFGSHVLDLYFKLKKTLTGIKLLVYNLSLLMTFSSSPHLSVPFIWWNFTRIFGSRNKWHIFHILDQLPRSLTHEHHFTHNGLQN